MAVRISSKLMPLELSFDGGTSWKTLVCVSDYTGNLSQSTTETETLTCGTLVSQGAVKFDFSGSAVADLDPAAGLVSMEDLENCILASTEIKARQQYNVSGSVGQYYYKEGTVIVESVNNKQTAADFVKFDFSLKGTGLPTKTPV